MRAVVVGLRMGANHAQALTAVSGIDLVALCDIDREVGEKVAAKVRTTGASRHPPEVFVDYETMLRAVRPDIVGIATPTRFHCEMTLAAVEAGVKAVYCEKPIAIDLGEARRMAEACNGAGVRLIVNHQRRIGPDFLWMREQLEARSIGEPYVIRGTCAGDMLSDGTHLIDSMLFITGDVDWKWVFAAHHRDAANDTITKRDATSGGGFDLVGGWRFGHPVEDGMMTICELENGLRMEFFTGDLRLPGRPYHDIEVIGTKGSLLRSGDLGEKIVFHRAAGEWEQVPEIGKIDATDLIREAYARAVYLIRNELPDRNHPMGSPYAMRGFELLMGAYESARVGTIIRRPVAQERYPLAVELGQS